MFFLNSLNISQIKKFFGFILQSKNSYKIFKWVDPKLLDCVEMLIKFFKCVEHKFMKQKVETEIEIVAHKLEITKYRIDILGL